MRILLVSSESFLTSGSGIATYTDHAVKAHLAHGHEVHLLTHKDQTKKPVKAFKAKGFKATILDNPSGKFHEYTQDNYEYGVTMAMSKAAEELIRKEDFDVIEGTDFLFSLHRLLARKRAGLVPDCPPIVTFNHGIQSEFQLQSAILTPVFMYRTLCCEEQALQWADGVIAPSQHAADVMGRVCGSDKNVFLIREPYMREAKVKPNSPCSSFLFFGRVDFRKGIDRFAHLLNTLREFHPVENVVVVGSEPWCPFRDSDVQDFFKKKLHPDLEKLVTFHGAQPVEDALILAKGCDFHVNLSRYETFSYTSVETIFSGVQPLVEAGSPMAEFLPPDMANALLDAESLHGNRLRRVMRFWEPRAYVENMKCIHEYVAPLVSSETFTRDYANMVDRLAEPARTTVQVEKPYTGKDVTVLISCHNDGDVLNSGIQSLEEQTEPVHEIVIFDDGSTKNSHDAILRQLSRRPKIRVIRHSNVGLVAARVHLLEEVQTPLLIFMDADDYLDKKYVEKTLLALNGDADSSAVLTYRKNFGLNDSVMVDFFLGSRFHWVLNDFRMTALLKTDAVRDIGFDPEVKNGEADDWLFWLRFTVKGYKALQCPLPLFRYRFASGSMSWPWSEGHAATTTLMLQRIVAEAAEEGYDLTEAMQTMQQTLTRLQWDGADRVASVKGPREKYLKALRDNRWILLGGILGQAKGLRDSLNNPNANVTQVHKHLRDSGWMKIGRTLRLAGALPDAEILSELRAEDEDEEEEAK